MADKYHFTYFALPGVFGRGSSVRLLLTECEADFDDKRVEFADFKKDTTFGALPTLKHGDNDLVQKGAIMYYVAHTSGKFIPEGVIGETKAIQLINSIEDITLKFVPKVLLSQDKEKTVADFGSNDFPRWLEGVAKCLGDKDYFTGANIAYCDFDAFLFLNACMLNGLGDKIDAHPTIKAFVERVRSRPITTSYLEKESPK